MSFIFSNLAEAVLVRAASGADTALYIDSSLASRFAAPTGAEVQRCSLTDDSTSFELVDITANPLTGALTVTRGVESTSARTWAGGTRIRQEMTAAVLASVSLTSSLALLSALTPEADKGVFFASTTSMLKYSLSGYFRGISDSVDVTDLTTRLGILPGVNVQPFDASLGVYVASGGLTAAELVQLRNINTTAISILQWGYLGQMSAFFGGLTSAVDGAAFATALGFGAGDTVAFGAIELGHASDTSITRASAGRIAIEGNEVTLNTATQTLSGKTLTSPIINGGTIAGCTSLNGTISAGTNVSGALDATDADDLIFATGAITINISLFTARQSILIINTTSSGIALTQGAGGTQRLLGSATTGNLTIAAYGAATIIFVSATEWYVGGNVA
jgi:hypothetical protein